MMDRARTEAANMMRGASVTLVLSVLQDGPAPGYAIADAINERANGLLELKEGTIYALLQTMENKGLIECEWVLPTRGRPRRTYRLTDAGREELAERLRTWHRFATAVSRVTGVDLNEEPA